MKKLFCILALLLVFALASCAQAGNSDTSANTSADPATDATSGNTSDTSADTTAPKPVKVTPNRTGEITVGGETLVLPEFDPFVISKANPRPANSGGATDSVPEEDYDKFNIAIVSLFYSGGEKITARVETVLVEPTETLEGGGLVGFTFEIGYYDTWGAALLQTLSSYHYALVSFAPGSGYGVLCLPIKDGKIEPRGSWWDPDLFDYRYAGHCHFYFLGINEIRNGLDVSDLPGFLEEKMAQILAEECYGNTDVPVLGAVRLSELLPGN